MLAACQQDCESILRALSAEPLALSHAHAAFDALHARLPHVKDAARLLPHGAAIYNACRDLSLTLAPAPAAAAPGALTSSHDAQVLSPASRSRLVIDGRQLQCQLALCSTEHNAIHSSPVTDIMLTPCLNCVDATDVVETDRRGLLEAE